MTAHASVVICAYDLARWDDVTAAVESVRSQEPPPAEVLVVIDHNEVLLARMRREVAEVWPGVPAIRVLASQGPPGLSGARNTGVTAATGDVVAFLDDDAVAEPGWLTHLVGPYYDSRVVAVGGWVEPTWDHQRPSWFPDEFGWVVGCSYRGQPTSLAPVRNPIGANMSFRRSSLAGAGGFSDRVGRNGADGRGCEETEAAIRVCRAIPEGLVLLEPRARVRHRVPATRSTWAYFRRRCFAEGQSKALVSRLVGSGAALQSERTYVRSTLPSAVVTSVATTWHERDISQLRPAAAIIGGFVATASGYAVATVTDAWNERGAR